MQLDNNPFANVGNYNNVSFAPEEEVKAPEIVEETKVEEEGDPEKVEKEIEDVLDKPVSFADEETAKVEEETKAALTADEDEIDWTNLAKQNIKAGVWKDYKDSDTIVLDKEAFLELWELQEGEKKTQIKESVFADLDADDKELIEFKKNGGNIDLWYQARQRQLVIQNLDITTDQGKQNAIYTYYKNYVGWSDEKIQKHISKLVKDLEIDEEAQDAYEKLEAVTKTEREQLLKQQSEAAKQKETQIKEYKNTLKTALKEYGIEGSKASKVIESFTQIDPESNLTPLDKAYISAKVDPKRAIQLYKYLEDSDKFIQEAAQKLKEATKKETFFELKNAKKQDTNILDPIKTNTKKQVSPFTLD